MCHVSPDKEALASLCRRHHIHRLALFGSLLRDDFSPHSDIDVLVEFDPANGPTFFDLAGMEGELSQIFGGRRVDLVTAKSLNRRIRDRVLAEAEVQYAEG